jgi:uncharacterized damage-inducible protein DinB
MPRQDPALASDEVTTLHEFLDFHRATLLMKVAGLSSEQAASRPIPSTELTISGLVKHLAYVEDIWFQERFLGLDLPEPWHGAPFDDDPDWELHSAPGDDVGDLVALYESSCERSRRAVRGVALDQLSVVADRREGVPYSLRWILVHMIEETARHNGHVDLLREAIDGAVGE